MFVSRSRLMLRKGKIGAVRAKESSNEEQTNPSRRQKEGGATLT
jgi:hypothetical protein